MLEHDQCCEGEPDRVERIATASLQACVPSGDYRGHSGRLAWISEGANKSWCSPTGARPVRVRP
jgi:hypothetical protein